MCCWKLKEAKRTELPKESGHALTKAFKYNEVYQRDSFLSFIWNMYIVLQRVGAIVTISNIFHLNKEFSNESL